MVTTNRCPECGEVWVEKTDVLTGTARTGYEKVDSGRGKCASCGAVQTV